MHAAQAVTLTLGNPLSRYDSSHFDRRMYVCMYVYTMGDHTQRENMLRESSQDELDVTESPRGIK